MNLTNSDIKVMIDTLKALESRDSLTVEEKNLLDKLEKNSDK